MVLTGHGLASILLSILVLVYTPVLATFVPSPVDFTITPVPHLGTVLRHKALSRLCSLTNSSATQPTQYGSLSGSILAPNSSFSGYADLSPTSHVFFLFFTADHPDPQSLPLTVWINGGPGSSSMRGAFQENGPCMIMADGRVEKNPWSWNRRSNMLYIDQPVTTGLSYTVPVDGYVDPDTGTLVQVSTTCPSWAPAKCGTFSKWDHSLVPNSTAAAAPEFWKTLQSFLHVFSQFARSGVHLATESYGGKYIPIFADYIVSQNKQSRLCRRAKGKSGHSRSVAPPIPLKSVIIGNGWTIPSIQYPSYYNFTVNPGNTYDFRPMSRRAEREMENALFASGNCVDQLRLCNSKPTVGYKSGAGSSIVCQAATRFCFLQAEYVLDMDSNRNEYDFRNLMPDPFPPSGYADYLNRQDIQADLGATVNFTDSSDLVGVAFDSTGDDSRDLDLINITVRLLDAGVRVVHHAGDADYICNWVGCEMVADEVGTKYGNGRFLNAHYVNLTTSDRHWHGQVKEAGLFSFTRVFGAGHEVPFYQPVAALALFERVIDGTDIATGQINVRQAGPRFITRQPNPGENPTKSTYHQGRSSIQFSVLPANAVWDRELGVVIKQSKSATVRAMSSPSNDSAVLLEGEGIKSLHTWSVPSRWKLGQNTRWAASRKAYQMVSPRSEQSDVEL